MFQQGEAVSGLQCLPVLEICVFCIHVDLLVADDDRSAAHTHINDDKVSGLASDDNTLEIALSSREPQVSTLCGATLVKVPSLKYLVVMGGGVIYGMRRGGMLARKRRHPGVCNTIFLTEAPWSFD